MADQPRVQELLDEILDSERTPEEVCGDCPEMLPEVRKRWQQMRVVQAELMALFPTPGSVPGADTPFPWHSGTQLPRIPGYEVDGLLGRGGMGVVYKARHLRLNRTVALKMLLAGAYAGPHELVRFQREAEAVAGLRHANIVQVYDVGDHEGRPYFTMEFIEGGSLAQELAGIPQPARQAAALAAALAEAVEVAHQGGIVHRDLKPANILLAADGTPKISDFGLARRVDGGAEPTQSGSPLGTPSYMAPEQARGTARAIGPAVDVYALGAILYELLTGRPPFRAETAAETVLQVIYQEPAPPSRLNAKVPRDLETVCLNCLHKEPERRYASAAALADDLRRFQEGRPIRARPLGWGGRLWRWGRRKPAAAALVATALALVALALGGGLWLERQQAERRAETAHQEGRARQAVEAALQQAAALQEQGRWPEARAALEAAPSLLDASAPADLRERVRQARADADMVAELEEIRLRLLEGRKSHEKDAPSGDQLYAEAFQHYGIPLTLLEPADAAARVRNSAIRDTLLAFLHDWLYCASDTNRDRLRAVVERADDDAWRRGLREALTVKEAGKLHDLMTAPAAPGQPPVVLAGLGGALTGGGQEEEARRLLREAQQRHPEDFWINFQLGYLSHQERPQEAVGYFRAAVASRPGSSQAHRMLGRALRDTGDADGALAAFRNAIALNPNRAGAKDLATVLAARGRLEEVRGVWQKILEGDPPNHDVWYGYAQLCAFLGDEEAYRRACKALPARFADSPNHWTVVERDSLACLLLPASGDDLRRAVMLTERAVAAGPRFPHPDHGYIQFVKGLAEYRQGRPEQAIPWLQESAAILPNRAGPRLVLAMALFQTGATKEARKALAAAIPIYNWQESQADDTTAWVSHVLRREAEAMILANLPAFLRGEYQPQDNDERLALLGICQSQGRYGTAARLYADAFAADPDLADDLSTECRFRAAREEVPLDRWEALKTECRYLAARCAALAGCGLGKDGPKLTEAERTRWRKQARAWLRADLAVWARMLDSDSGMARELTNKMLTHWQVEPDLAGLREPNALNALAADERMDCLALWHEVGVVRMRAEHRQPVALDPKHTDSPGASRTILLRQGRVNEARVAWLTAVEANPPEHDAWFGYAEFCLFLGREDEYRRARQALLARFGASTDPYVAERTGRACMLLPATGDELRQAVVLAGRAAAADRSQHAPAYPYFLFAQGLAEYRQGRLDQAISAMRGDASRVLGPASRLVLAMALHRSGQAAKARKTLAEAVLAYDWRADQARDPHYWICHVLRREAEAMMIPNLPAFLDEKYQPQDNDERLALLGVCQFTNRSRARARLYANAFAATPHLAEDLGAAHRTNAARAAALAGCGRGADATGLGEEERKRWRDQARQWLRADLVACQRLLDGDTADGRELVRQTLMDWQGDPDLAGLREPTALEKFSADERQDCLTLWKEVGVVLQRTGGVR
jgi:serine/threonine-protein kinase